jgi:hypothetical protein
VTRIPPSTHRLLDGLTVIGFAAAPLLVPLSGPAAWLAWTLATVHLLMTLATRSPDGRWGIVPLRWHGAVELVVGITLPGVPFVAGWVGSERWFYLLAGGVILVIRLASQFTPGARVR